MSTQPENTDSLRIIIPPACADRCRKLQNHVDDATTRMQEDSDIQMTVICERKRTFGCGARTLIAGQHEYWQSTRVFLPNPAIYETYGTVTRQIQNALDQGAVETNADVRSPL